MRTVGSAGLAILAACGGARSTGGGGGGSDVTTVPSHLSGRYVLAAASQTAAIEGAKVFVTLDGAGVARVGTFAADALDGGALVSMPQPVEWGDPDSPDGTPGLAATVAGLLGPGAPAMVLDDESREEIRTSGCTHVTGSWGVSWGYSAAQKFETLAFVQAGASATASTVILADRDGPALRLIQAADETPDARIAVAAGETAAALAIHLGGAVSLGDPICISSNRRVDLDGAHVEVQGDGIEHGSFGAVPISGGTFDRAALIAAYRAALAADQLDADDKPLLDVGHDVTVATLVAVIDALLEAGETRFVLHALPDLQKPAHR